jgi:hypothetical protein
MKINIEIDTLTKIWSVAVDGRRVAQPVQAILTTERDGGKPNLSLTKYKPDGTAVFFTQESKPDDLEYELDEEPGANASSGP